MPPGGRPGRVSQKPVQRLRGLVRLMHPKNGYADHEGGRKLGLASDGFLPVWAGSGWSLALPGLWMVRGSGGGSTRHPLESFQTGRGYESTPRAKVQTTTWPGSQGPAFRLPSAAQPDRAPKSPHAPLLSLPAPAKAAPGSEHIIPTSKSFLAPSPFPQAGSGTPSGRAQAPGSPGQP